ncbi:hypothetical protein GCG54_00013999 [Colletotrichum gloeosporioides]|uniref:Uncharacterized protein n=1 Tax=Colletotrichum gloeosporioides TaxID=474922 RepID=A0A8H4CF14_COLGL|nr:uncharacterized protein GCG54_00013999 [Colletotrichum gloeosporioides]KAF3802765.1 hypothetical protein GCG54_00013999 [Colletotrichum gloeosporioides]
MRCAYSDNGAPSSGSGELTALQLFNNKYPSPGSQKSTRSAPAKDSAPSLSSQKSTSPELPNDSHLRSGSQRSMRSAPISNVFGTRCIRRLNVQEGDLLQDLYAWGTRVDDWIGTITPHPPSTDDDIDAITPAPPRLPSAGDDVDAITPAPPLSHSQGSDASSSETKITDPNANKKPYLPGSSLPNDAIDSEKKQKPGNTYTLGATQPKVETTNDVQPPNEPADVKKRKNL